MKLEIYILNMLQHPDFDYADGGVPRFDVAVATVDTITYDDFIQVK